MGRKILLKNIDIPGIDSFEVYRHHNGYTAVEKALNSMSPSDVAKEVTRSGCGAGWRRIFHGIEMEFPRP